MISKCVAGFCNQTYFNVVGKALTHNNIIKPRSYEGIRKKIDFCFSI